MKVYPIEYWVGPHTHAMRTLLRSRGMDEELIGDVPSFGLVAYEYDEPVAAGFVRCIEGHYAMLDSYITNPNFSPEIRDRALTLITSKLIKICRANGVTKLFVFTADENTFVRSLKHEFSEMPNFKFSLKVL